MWGGYYSVERRKPLVLLDRAHRFSSLFQRIAEGLHGSPPLLTLSVWIAALNIPDFVDTYTPDFEKTHAALVSG